MNEEQQFNIFQHYNRNYKYLNQLHSTYYSSDYNFPLEKLNDTQLLTPDETVQEVPLNLSVSCNSTNWSTDEAPIDYSLPKSSSSLNNSEGPSSHTFPRCSDEPETRSAKSKRRKLDSGTESEESLDLLLIDEDVSSTKEHKNLFFQVQKENWRLNRLLQTNFVDTSSESTRCNTQQDSLEPNSSTDVQESDQSLLSAHSVLIQKYQKQVLEKNRFKFNVIKESHYIYPKDQDNFNETVASSFFKYHKKISEFYEGNDNLEDMKLFELFKYGRAKAKSHPLHRDWQRESCRKCLFKRKHLYKGSFDKVLFCNHASTSHSPSDNHIQSQNTRTELTDTPLPPHPPSDCEPRTKCSRNEDHSYFKKAPGGDPRPIPADVKICDRENAGRKSLTRKKQYKRCSLCLNHGIITKMRGHIGNCQFQYCKCSRCLITKARQLHMLRQQRLTRQISREKKCNSNHLKKNSW